MRWVDEMSDEAWDRFERISFRAAMIFTAIMVGLTIWVAHTI